MSKQTPIPEHVAIIMDGNGRWAKQHGKERYEGHIAGVESVRRALRAAAKNGVKWLTLYAFSTENWGRPTAEVNAIMELFCKSVVGETPDLVKQGVRVMIIGERTHFSAKVVEMIDQIESVTAEGDRLTLVLAFNYSSRREIMLATQAIAHKVSLGELRSEDIDEEVIARHLMTSSIPDPDLIVRTSGECRLSNFLLWQASYAEFYFPKVLWPDFDEEEFTKALEVYASRERRYGLVTEDSKTQ
ncbi:MAG: di-trans,poly-cis-decaprenylcistransferase [Alistipes sp.]|nr:di-trans,poly-cis-decaprenylcistransferase [Alistipes sp.]